MRQDLRTSFIKRQYMQKEDFELYYYSDQQPQQVPVHTHDHYEFYFFLDGRVAIRIQRKLVRLQAGDVVIIPPGVRHQAVQDPGHADKPAPPYKRFVLWISQDYLQKLMSPGSDYSILLQASHSAPRSGRVLHMDEITFNSIQARIFSLLEEIHTARFGREVFIFLGLADLLMRLTRTAYEQENRTALSGPSGSLYENTVRYIENHIEEPLTLDVLADNLHTGKYYLAHLFKEKNGISLHRYITDKRLSLSLDALFAGEQAGEACRKFGFSDYSAFYRAFLRRYGVSPREYLRQHRRIEKA